MTLLINIPQFVGAPFIAMKAIVVIELYSNQASSMTAGLQFQIMTLLQISSKTLGGIWSDSCHVGLPRGCVVRAIRATQSPYSTSSATLQFCKEKLEIAICAAFFKTH